MSHIFFTIPEEHLKCYRNVCISIRQAKLSELPRWPVLRCVCSFPEAARLRCQQVSWGGGGDSPYPSRCPRNSVAGAVSRQCRSHRPGNATEQYTGPRQCIGPRQYIGRSSISGQSARRKQATAVGHSAAGGRLTPESMPRAMIEPSATHVI